MKAMSALLSAYLVSWACLAVAADSDELPFLPAGDESAGYQAEVVLKGLDNPSGLIVRPSTNKDSPQEIFFSESGAGRIKRFKTDSPAQTTEVIAGFESRALSEEIALRLGPWSLGFVTPTKLAVLGGMQKEGYEQVAIFVLPDDVKILSAGQFDHTVELSDGYAKESSVGFPGMVFGETAAFMTIGPNSTRMIYKGLLAANRIDSPRSLVSTREARSLTWPAGLCLSPSARTQFLLATFLGDLSDERDSLVAFFIPSSGDLALRLSPGLFDVMGLAYSPSGQLYAIDFAWQDENAGGVYRLDDARLDGRPACRAVKIASIVHPTSLLFDDKGMMYVTSLGEGTNGSKGTITKITGSF